MYWALFFLGALITIAGFCLIKRRMKNYRDEEEEEEAHEGDDQQTEE